MNKLSNINFVAPNADAQMLTSAEIALLWPELEGWELIIDSDIQKLKRVFNTKNYSKSMSFTNAVAELAESVGHHPQIIVEYGTVTVVWWSHNLKGLHKNDFVMAAKTSELF